MKTKMEIMKIWRLAFAMVAVISLASCSDDDGDWDAMKWSSEQSLKSENGTYIISAEEQTVTFVCKNYKAPWLEYANVDGEYFNPDWENYDNKHIQGEWFSVAIEENRLIVTFTKNTAAERSVTISTTAGDIWHLFRFRQLAGN